MPEKIVEILDDFLDESNLEAEAHASVSKEMKAELPKHFKPDTLVIAKRDDTPVFWIAFTSYAFFIETVDKSQGTADLVRKLADTMKDSGIKQRRATKEGDNTCL